MSSEPRLRTTPFDHGITAIDTDYVRPYQDASHLLVAGGRAAFVDTGTNHSVPLLLGALKESGIDRGDVDYVFLTHVHLDHAGGAGQLMAALPHATAVLHPRGARHMIDPGRLVQGTKAVYGAGAFHDLYGEIVPIPESRLLVVDDGQVLELGGRPLYFLYTEGHARHHYCLYDPTSAGIFTGDSFGVSYRELDTAAGEFVFPTTTPVHFDPLEAHRAVDRIMAREPRQLFLTHYSRVTGLERLAADMHRGIDDYVDLAKRHADSEARGARMRAAMFHYLVARLREHGVTANDERLHELLDMDIGLNTMGLEHWLDHGSPS